MRFNFRNKSEEYKKKMMAKKKPPVSSAEVGQGNQ